MLGEALVPTERILGKPLCVVVGVCSVLYPSDGWILDQVGQLGQGARLARREAYGRSLWWLCWLWRFSNSRVDYEEFT